MDHSKAFLKRDLAFSTMINRSALLTIFVLSIASQSGISQTIGRQPIEFDKPSKSLYLKTNPLTLLQGPIPFFSGEARLGLEMVGSEKVTYQASASYLFKSPLFALLTNGAPGLSGADFQFKGYRFQGQVRYYYIKFYNKQQLSKVLLPSGLYISLHGSYSSGTLSARNIPVERIEFTHLNTSVIGGMQAMYKDAFGVDFFLGLGYKHNVITYFKPNGTKEFLDPVNDLGFTELYAFPLKLTAGFNLTFGLL